MNDPLDWVNILGSGNYIAIISILAFYLIKNQRELIQSWGDFKTSKANSLESALKSDYVNGLTKSLLEDQLEQHYCNRSNGLNFERPIREIIIQVHNYSGGNVKFEHFIRAKGNYIFKNPKLSVRWGCYEKFFNWVFAAAFILSIFAFGFFAIATLYRVVSINFFEQLQTLELLFLSTSFFLSSLIYLLCWRTLFSISIVKEEVDSYYRNITIESDSETSGVRLDS